MLVDQQVRESQQINVDEINGQETKCKSSKMPTHFTIPQQNQSKKNTVRGLSNKLKNKKSVEDKQYRKLNKQSRKVKSLQEQYHELQQQIKQVKQMVELQLQLINHTSKYDTQSLSAAQRDQLEVQKSSQKNNTLLCNQINDEQKVNTDKLQKLIKSLFDYQSTIQTANSNYLLLSQVNKEQQSESLFHINNLQDRIRQLRFLLNGKEDLLAYEIATINDTNINNTQQQDQMKPISIDYHMPKKMTMANFNNMDSEYKLVQKTVQEMAKLKNNVEELQEQLRMLEKVQNSQENEKQNEEEESKQVQKKYDDSNDKSKRQQPRGCLTLRYLQQNKQLNINNLQLNTINPSMTTRATSSMKSSAISKTNLHSQNITHSQQQQLKFLPLSTTNYKSALIYKVAKLNSIQKQKSQNLKQNYKQLMNQYQQQVETKRKLVSQYQIQRDIYQYKKKQSINNKKTLLNRIMEEEEQINSEKQVSVDNILAEIHFEEEKQKYYYEEKPQYIQSSIQAKTFYEHIPNTPSTLITVRSSLSSQQDSQSSSANYHTVQQSSDNKDRQQNTGLFNEITNTPQKESNKTNPFLKLKLKPSYQKSQPINSNINSPKNKTQSYTPSRFSLHKQCYDKENPSLKKQLNSIESLEKQNGVQSLSIKQQKSNFNPIKDPSFNTPTKRRRLPTVKKAQSTIQKQFSTVEVKN